MYFDHFWPEKNKNETYIEFTIKCIYVIWIGIIYITGDYHGTGMCKI